MKSSHQKWTRRALLRRIGAGAAVTPFLPLLESDAEAQVLPKRFVAMVHGHGWPMYTLLPKGDANGITSLNLVLKPLAPYQQQVTFITGLDHKSAPEGASANEHQQGQCSLLTCVPDAGQKPNAISIDQVIAASISQNQKYRSFEVGVAVDVNASCLGPGKGLAPIVSPSAAFDRLFKDLVPGANSTALAKARAERQSVIDFVKGEVGTMRPKLGQADTAKLDGHLAAIREIELNLARPEMTAATTCTAPTVKAGINPMDTAGQYNLIAEAQVDILAMALRCDLTRVASMIWSESGAGPLPTGVPTSRGTTSGGHDLAHDASRDMDATGPHTQRCTYYAKTIAERLLAKLAEVPEGNGTMFDRTVTMWTTFFSDGTHNFSGLSAVLAGGKDLGLKGNRFLSFEPFPSQNVPGAGPVSVKPIGKNLSDLYVSLANLYGINMTTFGKAAYCTGPLTGLVG